MMLSLIGALVTAASNPCGPIDLPTALALASQRSDEVAIQQAELASAQVDRALASAAGILPVATATILAGPSPAAHGTVTSSLQNNRTPFQNLGPFAGIQIQLIQPIWTWGQLSSARDAAAAGVQAREKLVEDTVSHIELRVIQLFWGEMLARRLLDLAAEVEKALADVDRHITTSLAKGDGDVTLEDRYRVDLFRSQLVQRKADAERALELAHLGLAATLALPNAELVLKDATLEASPAPVASLEEELTRAEDRRPDLKALTQAIRARQAEVQATFAAMLPQIFVIGEADLSRAPNRDIQTNPWVSDPFNQFGAGVALGIKQDLSIPTLNAKANKAQAEEKVLEAQRAGLLRLVRTQVEAALVELAAGETRLEAARGALAAGRNWFRSAAQNFDLGVTDARGLTEAYRAYVESQLAQAQSTYDVLVARAALDQATGSPPTLGDPACYGR
jgi:outer membrane protein TolC